MVLHPKRQPSSILLWTSSTENTQWPLTCRIRGCCSRCHVCMGPPCTPRCPPSTTGPRTPAHMYICTCPQGIRTRRHYGTAWRRSDPAARSADPWSPARRCTSSCPGSSACTCHRSDRDRSRRSWPPGSRTGRLSSRWGRCTRRWGWPWAKTARCRSPRSGIGGRAQCGTGSCTGSTPPHASPCNCKHTEQSVIVTIIMIVLFITI
jgi:hypothetical protein